MSNCAVATCRNSSRITKGSNIKYFRFPYRHEDLVKQWVHACQREDKININNARICSVHFDENCFEIPLRHRLLQYNPKASRYLKPDAVPTLHIQDTSQKCTNTDRQARAVKKKQIEFASEFVEVLIKESSSIVQASEDQPQPGPSCYKPTTDEIKTTSNIKEVSRNTNIEVISEIDDLKNRIQILEKLNRALLQQVKSIKNSTAQRYEKMLATVFTPGQIKKLLNPERMKKMYWSAEDIASAISLHNVSPKAYRYLKANNYPLPTLSTLRKGVSNFKLSQGLIKNVKISPMKKESIKNVKISSVKKESLDLRD